MKTRILNAVMATLMVLLISSCAERRYYKQNHRHTDGYEHRHRDYDDHDRDRHN